jgi:hypothetical protein
MRKLCTKYSNQVQINNLTINCAQITQTSNCAQIVCKLLKPQIVSELCTNYLNFTQINSLTTNCAQITQTSNYVQIT